ncbi:MAG: VOC family protein [Sphingomicrobium sp.]|nr:VOC family protein [Sphingomonadales bacterium]
MPHRLERSRGLTLTSEVQIMLFKLLTRLPATDLDRARLWYAEKLGLDPAEEREGGLRYIVGGCEFALFTSHGVSDGSFTQMGFEVSDLAATVAELKRRGVVFEEYHEGPLRTENGIAKIEGNYASKGVGEYAAWLRDSEGNMIGLGQPF